MSETWDSCWVNDSYGRLRARNREELLGWKHLWEFRAYDHGEAIGLMALVGGSVSETGGTSWVKQGYGRVRRSFPQARKQRQPCDLGFC